MLALFVYCQNRVIRFNIITKLLKLWLVNCRSHFMTLMLSLLCFVAFESCSLQTKWSFFLFCIELYYLQVCIISINVFRTTIQIYFCIIETKLLTFILSSWFYRQKNTDVCIVNTYINRHNVLYVIRQSIRQRHGLSLIHNADNEETNIKCAQYRPFIPFASDPYQNTRW